MEYLFPKSDISCSYYRSFFFTNNVFFKSTSSEVHWNAIDYFCSRFAKTLLICPFFGITWKKPVLGKSKCCCCFIPLAKHNQSLVLKKQVMPWPFSEHHNKPNFDHETLKNTLISLSFNSIVSIARIPANLPFAKLYLAWAHTPEI